MSDRTVKFDRASAPYEAGDIAGFAATRAEDLVARGIAFYWPPVAAGPDILDAMDRAALVAYGKDHLGLADEPGPEVTDDELRAAIRAAVDPASLKLLDEPEPAAPAAKGGKAK